MYAGSNMSFLDFSEAEEGEGGEEALEDCDGIQGWARASSSCSLRNCYLRYSVENAFLEEKEDTCNALAEIAENVR